MRDGREALFFEMDGAGGASIGRMALTEDFATSIVFQSGSLAINPQFSPDGKWLAYESDESGQPEVYVRPYPNVEDGRWQISPEGGTRPAWAREGHELLYLDATQHPTVVPIEVRGGDLQAGAPVRLLDKTYYARSTSRGLSTRGYDVAADGTKFRNWDPSAP